MSVDKDRPLARPTWLYLMLIAIVAVMLVAMIDYHRFHSAGKADQIVVELGGRTGHLTFWPLGGEHYYTLTRPLTDTELERLKVLDARVGPRHKVGVVFDCALTDAQLKAARDALPHCAVGTNQQP